VEVFGDMIHHMVGGGEEYQPIYWLFFFIPSITIQMSGSQTFYSAILPISLASFGFAALYILAAAPNCDFQRYVIEEEKHIFAGGVASFLAILPLTTQLWLGIQSVALSCEDVVEAAKTVPRALLAGGGFMFVLSFVMLFIAVSHYPGVHDLEHTVAPMNYGYASAFNISEEAATIFSLCAVFGVGYAHMFAYTRQMMALSRSRLCGKIFKSTLDLSDAPVVTILLGSALAYLLLVVGWMGLDEELHVFLHTRLVFVYVSYFFVFGSFIILKMNFPTMTRKFTNPLGYISIVYGGIVFMTCMVLVLLFEETSKDAGIIIGIISALLVFYYYFVVSSLQTYSQEEQHLLLKLYVIKGNASKRKGKGKGKKQSQHENYSNSSVIPAGRRSDSTSAAGVVDIKHSQHHEHSPSSSQSVQSGVLTLASDNTSGSEIRSQNQGQSVADDVAAAEITAAEITATPAFSPGPVPAPAFDDFSLSAKISGAVTLSFKKAMAPFIAPIQAGLEVHPGFQGQGHRSEQDHDEEDDDDEEDKNNDAENQHCGFDGSNDGEQQQQQQVVAPIGRSDSQEDLRGVELV